ncbi:unnamed protein product [Cylicocyclus nassatus]|uniref:Uncharacterized protein n=1 Tax=Cylicocyclus nassatus TaxID=53992 RepID=A0AA36H6V5_CYLNA|nr:unnamed protein product [Cylicocyclus nassatus]
MYIIINHRQCGAYRNDSDDRKSDGGRFSRAGCRDRLTRLKRFLSLLGKTSSPHTYRLRLLSAKRIAASLNSTKFALCEFQRKSHASREHQKLNSNCFRYLLSSMMLWSLCIVLMGTPVFTNRATKTVSEYRASKTVDNTINNTTKEEWQYFRQLMAIIRSNTLTKQQRLEKIRQFSGNQTAADWENDKRELSKTIDLFDWLSAEKKRTPPRINEIFEKIAKMMFETEFHSKSASEQSRELRAMSKVGEGLNAAELRSLRSLLTRFEKRIDDLGMDKTSLLKTR